MINNTNGYNGTNKLLAFLMAAYFVFAAILLGAVPWFVGIIVILRSLHK